MPRTATITDELHQRITEFYATGAKLSDAEDTGNYPTADEWETHDQEAREILNEITRDLDLTDQED